MMMGSGNEAIHLWLSEKRSWEIAERMLQPISDLPLYICGEAYSRNQGWMEGALATTVEVLKRFGLSEPLSFPETGVSPNPAVRSDR